MTAADLADYKVAQRAPIECVHRGDRLFTAPPPSSGGVAICETLGILGDTPAGALHSVADAHREIEAERRALADRSSAMADPDFVTPPVAQLLAPAYLAQQRASITARATPSSAVKGMPIHEGTNTTNFSVVDADGNAVDVTYTLNSTFGSGLVAGDTGVLLNDEMDDFASAPGVPNQFGLVQGAANAIAPHKRPLSSMAPTIVVDPAGRVAMVAGAAGGPRIITTTIDLVRGVLDFGQDAGTAMNAPRLHQQWLPDLVYADPGAFTSTDRGDPDRDGLHAQDRPDRLVRERDRGPPRRHARRRPRRPPAHRRRARVLASARRGTSRIARFCVRWRTNGSRTWYSGSAPRSRAPWCSNPRRAL